MRSLLSFSAADGSPVGSDRSCGLVDVGAEEAGAGVGRNGVFLVCVVVLT